MSEAGFNQQHTDLDDGAFFQSLQEQYEKTTNHELRAGLLAVNASARNVRAGIWQYYQEKTVPLIAAAHNDIAALVCANAALHDLTNGPFAELWLELPVLSYGTQLSSRVAPHKIVRYTNGVRKDSIFAETLEQYAKYVDFVVDEAEFRQRIAMLHAQEMTLGFDVQQFAVNEYEEAQTTVADGGQAVRFADKRYAVETDDLFCITTSEISDNNDPEFVFAPGVSWDEYSQDSRLELFDMACSQISNVAARAEVISRWAKTYTHSAERLEQPQEVLIQNLPTQVRFQAP